MPCSQCQHIYNRITRLPVIGLTVCELCSQKNKPQQRMFKILSGSQEKLENIVTIPSAIIATLLAIAILCYLQLSKPITKTDFSNFRIYFICSWTFFMTHQLIILYRYTSNIGQTIQPQYMFVTLVRQVLFFNHSILVSLIWISFYLYNLYHHIYGYGSIFVLSTILLAFIVGNTPIKFVLLLTLSIVKFILDILFSNRLTRAITITVIYVGLIMLSFIGYYYEIELMALLEMPLLKYLPFGYLHSYKTIGICLYHTICLLLLQLMGKHIIITSFICTIVSFKLLVMPISLMVVYSVSHQIGVNLDMKIEVCAIVSCLLTPLAVSLSWLYSKIQW